MMVQPDICNGCGKCLFDCPKEAISRVAKDEVSIGDGCVGCQICVKLCPVDAIKQNEPAPGTVVCDHCPVHCRVPVEDVGACHRYRNVDGQLRRVVPLHVYDKSKTRLNPIDNLPTRPLLTGYGAGTNRPLAPARIIAQDVIEGVEVVTAVTEAVLSFSGVRVKLDLDDYIGPEGGPVLRRKKVVGHVTATEYGSRNMSVGGVSLLKSPQGPTVARTMTELANKEWVGLEVKDGANLEIAVDKPPIVNGQEIGRTSFGCGSSVGKLFSHHLLKLVDDCIMLDPGVTGQMAYHHAAPGAKPTGITACGKMSTPGRYLVPSGDGWGGTFVTDPRQAIAVIDKSVAWPGLRILVTETRAEKAAYFVLDDELEPVQRPLTEELENLLAFMRGCCQEARTNVLYVGGVGGGVRGALHPDHSPEVARAVMSGRIRLTAGGQKTCLMPGGNLIFSADVSPMPTGCFAWVPTPATVVPIEFTMTRKTYDQVCGYPRAVKPMDEVLQEFDHVFLDD
ncbi:MAG: 4Fe-4S binding protein [Deltaproteobacteria bacterium]|nr:4Fe-4S binding protein [Deltaproteobacteria bacterium]